MDRLIDTRKVGGTIKNLRERMNWTQLELAEASGYSIRNLRRIENLGTSSLDVINSFARIFKVSAIDILNGCLYFFMANKKCIVGFPHTCLTLICFSHTCTPG